jgi:hypothetical protein
VDGNRGDLDDVQLLLEEGGGDERDLGRILVLKISYHLKRAPSGLSAGYVFRHPHCDPDDEKAAEDLDFSELNMADDDSAMRKQSGQSKAKKQASLPPSVASTVYSTGGGAGALRDLDGIRCWLPCIDSPDQRAVFDITLHCPSHMVALTCGKKIATSVTSCPPSEKKERGRRAHAHRRGSGSGSDPRSDSLPSSADATQTGTGISSPLDHCFATYPRLASSSSSLSSSSAAEDGREKERARAHREISTSRFFTVTRLPAMSVGFFIGQVREGDRGRAETTIEDNRGEERREEERRGNRVA